MRRIIAGALLLGLLVPSTSLADGMAFPVSTGGSVVVRATEQRAILWLRGGTWELHIQPVFDREAGAAAWVVPFEVRPEVHESSADFFNQIELVTSPVFIEYCEPDSGPGFGCGMKGDASDQTKSQGGRVSVEVWEQGTVGDLDYAVLSAGDGESLVAWLAAEGYALPPGADALIAAVETEGVFFFASRLRSDVDPAKPLAPVRFVLPGLTTPGYPLQLTALGVAGDERLDITIWVIAPGEDPWVPDSHGYAVLEAGPGSPEEFDEALDQFFADHHASTIAVLANLDYVELYQVVNGQQFCVEVWGEMCVSFDELGIDPPAAWADGILDIAAEGARIVRYQARFPAWVMDSDLTFRQEIGLYLYADNVYSVYAGTCEDAREDDTYSFCSLGGRPGIEWALVVAVLALLGVALLRSRRR